MLNKFEQISLLDVQDDITCANAEALHNSRKKPKKLQWQVDRFDKISGLKMLAVFACVADGW